MNIINASEISGLHWTEKFELLNLALMLIFIPTWAWVSFLFMSLWMFSVVLKNTILKRWSFFNWHQDKHYVYAKNTYMLIPMIVIWCIYLVGMLWTSNKQDGWKEVGHFVWLAGIALTCLCTDFREVKKIHLRKFFWLYVLLMSLLFIVLLPIYLLKMSGVVTPVFCEFLTGESMFYHIHHSYMAVYIIAGLAFLYSECVNSEKLNAKKIALIAVCAICLLLFLLFINSRTGTLSLIILLMMCWLHLCFVRKKYRASLIAVVALVAVGSVVFFTLPDNYRRLSTTTEQVAQGDNSDLRIGIFQNAWMVIKDNVVFGVGTGDVIDELTPYYGSREDVSRPHNQYLETWMAIGLPGLITLLLMFLLPMLYAYKRRCYLMVAIIAIFAISNLFESSLERQMGMSLFCVMMIYFVIDTALPLASHTKQEVVALS